MIEDILPLAFDFTWKALVTAGVLIGVTKVGERLGPFMASIIMSMPMNAGPGYFFLALTETPEFLGEGGLISLAGGAAVFFFIAGFVRTALWRPGLYLPLAAGVLGWFMLVAVLEAELFTLNVASAIALVVIAFVVTAPFVVRLDLYSSPGKKTGTWSIVAARATVGGIVVAGAAVASKELGPVFAGYAFAFPTTMVATIWMLTRQFNSGFAAATLQSARISLINYLSFCLGLSVAPAFGFTSLQVWATGILASVISGATLALIVHRKRRIALLAGKGA